MDSNNPPKAPTPGWNDPPQLPYDPSRAAQTSSGRTKLTKRIAFPIQGAGAQQTSAHKVLPPLSAPPMDSNTKIEESLSCTTEEDLSVLHEQCSKVVGNLMECLSFSECDKDSEHDFKIRLKCLESQWKDNKFPLELREKLLMLSEALLERNEDTAKDLFDYVSENYSTVASGWIPIIAHILTAIHLKRVFG